MNFAQDWLPLDRKAPRAMRTGLYFLENAKGSAGPRVSTVKPWHVTQHLRRPCQISFDAEPAIVLEMQGRFGNWSELRFYIQAKGQTRYRTEPAPASHPVRPPIEFRSLQSCKSQRAMHTPTGRLAWSPSPSRSLTTPGHPSILGFAVINLGLQDGRDIPFPVVIAHHPINAAIGELNAQLGSQRGGRLPQLSTFSSWHRPSLSS